jgi:hypothetical protein
METKKVQQTHQNQYKNTCKKNDFCLGKHHDEIGTIGYTVKVL